MTFPHYFFCGVGGSGMMPLAMIVAARGARVSGSDRSLDQGRIADKFAALEKLGIALFPQDGSGVAPGQVFVASAAVEESVPDVVAANRLGLERLSRADLLAQLFNASETRIAIGGTSGKSTVTGMIGWILDQAGCDPTIMNGAVMKNYARPDAPFASARVGASDVFVSEVDESDGSIALYTPDIAVLNNVALDHKSMDELRRLFGDFIGNAPIAVVNADNDEALALAGSNARTFGFGERAALRGLDLVERPDGVDFLANGVRVSLNVPGRHNASNALAALAAAEAAGVALAVGAAALADFAGLRRRLDLVGSRHGVTVIDDFGHNPDKIGATLDTLHAFPGRLLMMFQPHGYGPLKLMGDALAETFRTKLGVDDRLFLPDPVYYGGTVDRSAGSDALAKAIGPRASHVPRRADIGDRLVAEARAGDRILIMGARDDTLSRFAADILERLDG
ncbi:MAG: UDP-N-acetylmuramate--alanine ligase [Sphingomonadales bacterium]|nr:UDP-N-acetylmuramate--alanine ligase [Sphingomonadales bacterium]